MVSKGIGRMNVGIQRSLSKWKKNNFIYNCYRGKYFEDDVKRHSSKSRDSKRDRSVGADVITNLYNRYYDIVNCSNNNFSD